MFVRHAYLKKAASKSNAKNRLNRRKQIDMEEFYACYLRVMLAEYSFGISVFPSLIDPYFTLGTFRTQIKADVFQPPSI
jgi:hypothetical protein